MNQKYTGDLHIFGRYQDQHKFMESTYSTDAWKTIDLLASLNEWQAIRNDLIADLEYCLELDAELHKELWALLIIHGTPQQIQVATLIYKGFTQMEIADQLGVSGNSNIHKILRGKTDYSFKPPRIHGGLATKLTKLIKESFSIKRIMKEIYNTDSSCYCIHYATFKRVFTNNIEFTQWLGVTL